MRLGFTKTNLNWQDEISSRCRIYSLREEFSDPGKRKVNEKVKNILITLGGADLSI